MLHTPPFFLPENILTFFQPSSLFMNSLPPAFLLFHFFFSRSLSFLVFYFFKLSSGSIGAFNRVYSLSEDTFCFRNRILQLSVGLSAAREQCRRECPSNSHTYLNTRLCFQLRLYGSVPRRSPATLSRCCRSSSFPSEHSLDVLSCHRIFASSMGGAALGTII